MKLKPFYQLTEKEIIGCQCQLLYLFCNFQNLIDDKGTTDYFLINFSFCLITKKITWSFKLILLEAKQKLKKEEKTKH